MINVQTVTDGISRRVISGRMTEFCIIVCSALEQSDFWAQIFHKVG